MNCQKCFKPIRAKESYHTTKIGSHHAICDPTQRDSLYSYLRRNSDKLDFAMRAQTCFIDGLPYITFYVRPANQAGETENFYIADVQGEFCQIAPDPTVTKMK